MFTQVKNEVNKNGKTFIPNKYPKSRPSESVLNKFVNLHITHQNYKSYKQASSSFSGFQAPPVRQHASVQ
jgi:hypothetical protein